MGRPKKQTVDYFPHFVDGSRKTLFVLEEEWRNDGYAFWFKLLELLCKSDGHFFDISLPADMRYLSAYTKVSAETATNILNTLAELGNIDRELWEQRQIIWCQSLVDNLKGLYDKRTTAMPEKPPVIEDFTLESPPTPNGEDKPPAETPAPEVETPKPRRPRKPKEDEPPKVKYADNVSMTEAEYNRLIEKFGAENAQKMIDKLDNAKGAKGYKYKSDYRAILNWVADEIMAKKGEHNERNETSQRSSGPATPSGFKPSGGFKR